MWDLPRRLNQKFYWLRIGHKYFFSEVRNMTEFAQRLFKCEDPDAEVIQVLLKHPRVEPVLERNLLFFFLAT